MNKTKEIKKTHWKKAFDSNFLSSSDIPAGGDLDLTIVKVELKEVKLQGKKKMANVATFKEKDYKPMILNVYNSKVVKSFAGGSLFLEDWKTNIRVTIYVQDGIRLGSDKVEGLRIRTFQPENVSTADAAKKELRDQIRIALSTFNGDREGIKKTLNEKTSAGEDTVKFYEMILEEVTQKPN